MVNILAAAAADYATRRADRDGYVGNIDVVARAGLDRYGNHIAASGQDRADRRVANHRAGIGGAAAAADQLGQQTKGQQREHQRSTPRSEVYVRH